MQEKERRRTKEPFSGLLEPWVEADLSLSSLEVACKRILKPKVIEGLSPEEG